VWMASRGFSARASLFAAVSEPLRPLLMARRLGELPTALSALDTALDAIDAPAFVVDRAGEILRANAKARALYERNRDWFQKSLTRAVDGTANECVWELTPLNAAGGSPGFLAILRARPQEIEVSALVQRATHRWTLTARQAQVLDLVARGLTNALIGESLAISRSTVEFHLSAIFDKAGVDNRATLIVRLSNLR
jgi:DNA-binding CsgD family transcriptional regulator